MRRPRPHHTIAPGDRKDLVVLHLRQTRSIWGPDQYILQLARSLPSEGIAVELAILDNLAADGDGHEPHPFLVAAREAGAVAEHLSARVKDLPWLLARLRAWVARRGISLIHSHEFKTQILGALLADACGIPHITSDHGQARQELFSMRMFYQFGLSAARRCDRVVVGSRHRGGHLGRQGFPESRVAYCPYGIDVAVEAPPDTNERSKTRSDHGAAHGDFVILCPARLDPQKDQMTLLRAFARVAVQHTGLRLWLSGTGESSWRGALQAESRRLGVAGRVTFLGFVPRMADLLAACDLVVLPSLLENFPYALLEAFLLARPVVATNVGGVPELVQDGANGWLVPPGAPAEMAEAIVAVLSDPRAAAARAAAGQRLVRERFSTGRMATELAEVYRSVVRRKEAG